MNLSPGTLLGSYEIKHRLGAGGMGEVYFARDTRLGRFVALKLLLPELTTNVDRLRRFKQEARTTSALNHPNIVTIFEVGETDSLHYLVTEFIDGVTLRRYLSEKTMNLREVLDIAIEATKALEAAQAEGIVHRDIKPENIMRRTDGIVKVLDFGLAKLLSTPDGLSGDENLPTALDIMTDPGSIVGTVTYMAPEQLRGMVDGRSDIWSLGVVIYEMIAGRPPFRGASKSDMIAAILREEPQMLTEFGSDAPVDLHDIISRMLRKDPAERYQSAKELLNDLRELKRELDLGLKLGREHLPSGGMSKSAATASVASEAKTERVQTSKIPSPRRTSGVDYLLSEVKRHRVGAIILGVSIAVVVLIGVVWYVATQRQPPGSSLPVAGAPQVSEIVTTSNVREAGISPDGKFIATVSEDSGRQSIRIQQPANAGQSQVLATGDNSYRGLVFSRDGYSIYYLAQKDQNPVSLYQVPVLGGAQPRKLIDDLKTPIALSPDGAHLAFVRGNESGTSLVIANADGTGVRELVHTSGQTVFGTLDNNNGPAWSPDAKVIACPMVSNGEPLQMSVTAVQVADGSMKRIGSQHWYLIGQMGWLSDGRGLIMTAQEKMPPASTSQIWTLSYPGGEPRRLTNDLSYYRGISVTADSTTLLTTRSTQDSNMWIVSGFPETQVTAVAASKNKGWGGLAWTADGKIVYASSEAGTAEIWSMDADGNNSRQLTFDKRTNVEPAVPHSRGDLIVFASYGTGQAHIWRMDGAGGNLRQLTNGSYEDWPDSSPDGQWVVYQSDDAGKERIWKISIEGGKPAMLIDKRARHPIVSPDGKWIACYLMEGEKWRLAILPFSGGQPVKTFEVPAGVAEQWHGPRWTADSQAVTYLVTRGGLSNIWLQAISTGPARQLTNFSEGQIFAFAWSTNDKRLSCVRGTITRTVILMKDFLRN